MVETSAMGVDYKKVIDSTLHKYEPKVAQIRTLFNQMTVDSTTQTLEYTKLIQAYTEAEGYEAFGDPIAMAEGTNAEIDDYGTITDTSSPNKYGKGWKTTDEMLSSSNELAKALVAQATVEAMIKLENDVNVALITAMSANAGTAYSAGATWSTTGDAIFDVNSARNTFVKRSAGIQPDFILFHPDDLVYVTVDDRVVNTLYPENTVKAGLIPSLSGMPIMTDTAVTSGEFYMGKKGMFADLLNVMPYKSFQIPKGAAGMHYELTVKYATQFKKPFYLLKGDSIA